MMDAKRATIFAEKVFVCTDTYDRFLAICDRLSLDRKKSSYMIDSNSIPSIPENSILLVHHPIGFLKQAAVSRFPQNRIFDLTGNLTTLL